MLLAKSRTNSYVAMYELVLVATSAVLLANSTAGSGAEDVCSERYGGRKHSPAVTIRA